MPKRIQRLRTKGWRMPEVAEDKSLVTKLDDDDYAPITDFEAIADHNQVMQDDAAESQNPARTEEFPAHCINDGHPLFRHVTTLTDAIRNAREARTKKFDPAAG